MLESLITPELAPGTNIKGDITGANWVFLLPALDPRRTLVIGRSSIPTLRTLARVSGEVVAAVDGPAVAAIEQQGLKNVRIISPHVALTALPDAGADVVFVASPLWSRRITGDAGMRRQLDRVLADGGQVHLHFAPGEELPRADLLAAQWRPFGFRAMALWLHTAGSEVRAAAPLDDVGSVAYVATRVVATPGARAWSRRLLWAARASGPKRRRSTCTAVVLGRSGDHTVDGVPAYVGAVAAKAGISLEQHRWAFMAPGAYRTKKALFFLFRQDARTPEYVVKLSREPRLNGRLENAAKALTQLKAGGLAGRGVLPEAAFFGHHGGLALLGERAVDGSAFRSVTSGRPDCPAALATIDWFVELGVASRDPRRASAAQVAGALESVLDRYVATYRPSRAHREFLEGQIASLSGTADPFPLVFQHGDPGTWNVMIDGQGRPVILDWEAAESHGMPLWDLFYFMRSYGVLAAQREGMSEPLRAFERHYLNVSPLSALLAAAARRFCEQAHMAPTFVQPLFFACWMHRALKEASRFRPEDLRRAHYAELVRRCIDQRDAPGLRSLFGFGT